MARDALDCGDAVTREDRDRETLPLQLRQYGGGVRAQRLANAQHDSLRSVPEAENRGLRVRGFRALGFGRQIAELRAAEPHFAALHESTHASPRRLLDLVERAAQARAGGDRARQRMM